MTQQIAIGETTGRIYARGTHAECSRRLNRTKNFLKEPIRIVKASREYEVLEEQIKQTVPVSTKKHRVIWTEEKNDFILEHQNMHIKDLTETFNQTFNERASAASINTKRTNLKQGTFKVTKEFWTKDQEETLRENYGKSTLSEIAKHTGKTHRATQMKAERMGLKESTQ